MREAVKTVTFVDIVFVLLLGISASIPGILGRLLYYASFIALVLIGFYSSDNLKTKREEVKGVREPNDKLLEFDLKRAAALTPLVFPVVLVIFTVSAITSMILSRFGVPSPEIAQKGIIEMIFVHALVPAVFEEALFRYIPMKLLLPYSKRWCVVYSALCFSLIHCNFYQMPYAFVAGILLMSINVALGSVWPSLIIHFLNNLASCIWMKYCTGPSSSIIFTATLILISLVSAALVYLKRDKYKEAFHGVFSSAESCPIDYSPILLVVITLTLAAASIL
jgi:membrane protease YdiL (CAAX protease family)